MTLSLLESLIPSSPTADPSAYEQLEEVLIKTFSTFESLNESFPNGKETTVQDPGVDLEAVRAFYTRLKELPVAQSLFLTLIKTSEVLLRRPGRPLKRKEDLRFLLIMLENPALAVNFFNTINPALPPSPQKKTFFDEPGLPKHSSNTTSTSPEKSFDTPRRSSKSVLTSPTKTPSTTTATTTTTTPTTPSRPRENSTSTPNPEAQHTQHSLMKRLYGIISNLPNELHHYLVNWFARLLAPATFRRRVELINSFITYRLGKHQKRAMLSGPGAQSKAQRQLYTNDWQIKASARMMALFFAANSNRPKIELSEFYNTLVCSFDPLYVFMLFFCV
jgi:hypothetical protein